MKICCRCDVEKQISEFNKDQSFKDGLRPFCRGCSKKEWKLRYEKNKKKESARRSAFYMANRERLIISAQKWQNENPFYKRYKQSRRRTAKINASPPWLNEIHLAQIKWYYQASIMMSETTGMSYEVDHYHALIGKNFCGLHVPWNLRVIKSSENRRKINKPPADESAIFWF